MTTTYTQITNLEQVQELDRDGDVKLCGYQTCTPNSPKEVQDARGLVFVGEELKVKTFPFCMHYTPDVEDLNKVFSSYSLDGVKLFKSREGTLLRVFYLQDKWWVSTHRKLNAFESRWMSQVSFGEMFEEALKCEYEANADFRILLQEATSTETNPMLRFFDTLNKEEVHTFLVSNSLENRVVCQPPPNPCVLYTGSFKAPGEPFYFSESIPLPTPEEIVLDLSDNPAQVLVEYLSELSPQFFQGVLVFLKDGYFKVLSQDYVEFSKLRGFIYDNEHGGRWDNEKNIPITLEERYFDIRMTALDDFLMVYPEIQPYSNRVENSLYKLSKVLKNMYFHKFIKKDGDTVPHTEFQVLKKCHKWHTRDRKNNFVTRNVIMDIINKQAPYFVKRLSEIDTQEPATKNEPQPQPQTVVE